MADTFMTPPGGLSNKKLALADATVNDVFAGKKFYAEDKTLKTGTFSLNSVTVSFSCYSQGSGNGSNGEYYTGSGSATIDLTDVKKINVSTGNYSMSFTGTAVNLGSNNYDVSNCTQVSFSYYQRRYYQGNNPTTFSANGSVVLYFK